MSAPDCALPLHPQALAGIRLFNAGEFFDAHEALESAWRDEPGPARGLYQGILQVAVTYLHMQRGNYSGALKVAARCRPKLEAWPASCRGVDVAQLRRDFDAALQAATRLGPAHIAQIDPAFFKPVRLEPGSAHDNPHL